jgi:DNA-binding protein Fis
MNAAAVITSIAATESAGVRQIWMNQEHLDTMTTTLRYDSLTDGVYSSAISVSEDSKLRQSIRNSALKETKMLDSIGMAQMEQEIQRRVIALTKQNQDRIAEESGIHSSLTEEDMKEYLESQVSVFYQDHE